MSDLQNQLQTIQKNILHFRKSLFLLLVVLVYGFVIWRVNVLSTAQPSQSAIASQTTLPKPHIDETTINKIKQLQDNSVNVQALFNKTRQNPFQE
jgi:hypothetical protein